MGNFPLDMSFSNFGVYTIFMLIGIGFGASLEMSGFGDSRKLSAQFYFTDMTVLKVMFTAIITAMLLMFLSSSSEMFNSLRSTLEKSVFRFFDTTIFRTRKPETATDPTMTLIKIIKNVSIVIFNTGNSRININYGI